MRRSPRVEWVVAVAIAASWPARSRATEPEEPGAAVEATPPEPEASSPEHDAPVATPDPAVVAPAPTAPHGPVSPPVDVLPSGTLARAAGIDIPDRAPSSAADRAARGVERRLRAALRADAIRSGRADSYHHDLGRSLRAAVRIDAGTLLRDALETSLPAAVVDEISRPTARERPAEPRGTPLPETADGSNDMDTSPLDEIAEQQSLSSSPVSWRRAVVRIHQDREGTVVRVTLVSSSGRSSVDAAALDAARHATVEGPPPARVLGDRTEITSDWAIEIGDVATSPAVVGCTDAGECAVLGHGVVRVRVELLDVEDATFEMPED